MTNRLSQAVSNNRSRLVMLGIFEIFWIGWLFFGDPNLWESYDYRYYHQFTLDYLQQAYHSLRIPYWTPHIAMGMPFAAYVEPAVFYPFNWLLVFIPVPFFAGFTLTAHGAMAFLSMGALSRRLGAGPTQQWIAPFLFLFSAPILVRIQLGHINFVNTLCYLPLLLLYSIRCNDNPSIKTFLQLTLVFFLQILCGHIQIIWISCFAVGALLTGLTLLSFQTNALRKWIFAGTYSIASLIIALLLAGFILLPLWELSQQGTRNFVEPPVMGRTPLFPHDLRSLFPMLPNIGAERLGYAGPLCTLLGISGLTLLKKSQTRGFILLIIISVTLGYSIYSLFFDAWSHLVPGYSMFRLHVRFLIPIILALSLAAGVYATRAHSSPKENWLRILAPALSLLSLEFILMNCYQGFEYLPYGRNQYLLIYIGAAAMLAALIYFWRKLPKKIRFFAIAAILLMHVFDISFYLYNNRHRIIRYNPDKDAITHVKEVIPYLPLKNELIPPRLAIIKNPNAALSYGFTTPYWYTPMTMWRIHYAMTRYYNLEGVDDLGVFADRRITQNDPFLFPGASIDFSFDSSRKKFIRNPTKNPRFFLSANWSREENWSKIISSLQNRSTKEIFPVFVEADIPSPNPVNPQPTPGSIKLLAYQAERLSFETKTEQDTILVMSESYFPGWKVKVDGVNSGDTFPVNIWMRGALIPAGTHQIEIYYDPKIFRTGLILTLFGLAVISILIWISKRSKKKSSG